MGGWRRGCQQWQHLTVEQPWSRLRVGHEQRALISPHRSPCDTVTGQSDRQCLKCLSTRLWMSFKKTGRYRKVEEDESGPPHFSLNVDRSKMSSSQPGLTPFLLSTCLQLSHFSSSPLHAENEWAFGRYHTCPVWSEPLDLVLIWIKITGVKGTFGHFLRQKNKIWLS